MKFPKFAAVVALVASLFVGGAAQSLAVEATTFIAADTVLVNSVAPSANGLTILGQDYAATRSSLGLVVNTNVQAYDSDLTTYAGITPSANVQTLLGSADYAAMRTSLSLVPGTNVQAYDADLTTYAGITPSANVQTLLGSANYSAFRSSLGVAIGTDVLAPNGSGASLTSLSASNISSGTLAAARGGAGTINGVLKANGSGVVSAATAGTDYAAPGEIASAGFTLTTNGTTGFVGTVTNGGAVQCLLPSGGIAIDGDGSVFVNASTITSGVVPAARGGAGTVNGLLKANGSGTVSAATAGTDYYVSGATTSPPQLVSLASSFGSPADATTYYFGGGQSVNGTAQMTTTAGNRRFYFPFACTITKAYVTVVNDAGAAGTTETSSLYIRKNNSSDTTVLNNTIVTNTTTAFNNTGVSLAIAAGDYIEMKWVTPTWATNPGNIEISVQLEIRP